MYDYPCDASQLPPGSEPESTAGSSDRIAEASIREAFVAHLALGNSIATARRNSNDPKWREQARGSALEILRLLGVAL